MGALSGAIAAAMLVITLCLPQTGLAESVKGIMQKFFYKNTDIVQDVMHNVYEDCDEHIRMKIEEMLSDGACIYFNKCERKPPASSGGGRMSPKQTMAII